MKVNCHQFTIIIELLQAYANYLHIQIPFQTIPWYALCWKKCKILKCRALKWILLQSFYFLLKNRLLILKDRFPRFFWKNENHVVKSVLLFIQMKHYKYIKKIQLPYQKISLWNIKALLATASSEIIFSKLLSVKTAFFSPEQTKKMHLLPSLQV